MAAGVSAKLIRAAFAEQHEKKQGGGRGMGFRAVGRMVAEGWQRWRGSGPGARGAAAAAAEEAVRQSAHRGSLSHADQLHPVDLTDAFNAANALQALWRGVVARRREQQEEAALRGVVVQNPVRAGAAVREARARTFDIYSGEGSAKAQRAKRGGGDRKGVQMVPSSRVEVAIL